MSNIAPINVKLEIPTITVSNWAEQKKQWVTLNKGAGGNPAFYPLTIKAWYALGIIYSNSASIEYLLKYRFENMPRFLQNQIERYGKTRLKESAWQFTYYSAYGIFASSIELLGYCLRSKKDKLEAGFRWLAAPDENDYKNVDIKAILVTTESSDYSVEDLCNLRHYIAHGQSNAKNYQLDNQLLQRLLYKMAVGLDLYWWQLQHSEGLCNKLAKASIAILQDRDYLVNIWLTLLSRDISQYRNVKDIFNQLNWQIQI